MKAYHLYDLARQEYDDDNLRNPEVIDDDWAINVGRRAGQLGKTAKEFLGPRRESLHKMWVRMSRQRMLGQ